jgi:hypothetical protein
MKIKILMMTIAVAMLFTACSKKNDTTVNPTDFTQYYIAGHYNQRLASTLTAPLPYAIIFKSKTECTFVDAVFGINSGSYTINNGHLVANFTGNLVANFDFTLVNNQISGVSADGLGLLTYNLETIPADNAFTNGKYTGTVTSPGTVALAYVAFSASQYSIGLSAYKTPNMAYTLQNNAVATALVDKNSSVFIYDNGAVMMVNYIPPSVVNGPSDYQFGTLTK